MSTFDELAAIQAGRKKPSKTVEVEFGGEMISLLFEEIPGNMWADLTARHPMRADSPVDLNCGYNHTSASREAAPLAGFLIVDGEKTTLTDAQWKALLGADPIDRQPAIDAGLDGNNFRIVVDAIWVLNEWEPSKRREALKKASRPATVSTRKRRSPSK